MRFFLLTFILSIALPTNAALVDSTCENTLCKIEIKSVNKISNVQWFINSKSHPSNSHNLEINFSKELEFINYSINYTEEGSGVANQVLSGLIKLNQKNQATGQSSTLYQGKLGTYIGIPFEKEAKLIPKIEYTMISDHIAKIKPTEILTTIHRMDRNGTKITENQVAHSDYAAGYSSIQITKKEFSKINSVIEGVIKTNINSKSIAEVEVIINQVSVKTKDMRFKFITEQPSMNITAFIHLTNMPTIVDKLTLINPLIEESECEFELNQEKLSVFCMSDIADIKKTQFYIEDYAVGQHGVVPIISGEVNKFTMVLSLRNQDSIRYSLLISSEGEVNVQKL